MAPEGGTVWTPSVTVKLGVHRYSKGCHLWRGGEDLPGGGNIVSDPGVSLMHFELIIVTDWRVLENVLLFCTWTLFIEGNAPLIPFPTFVDDPLALDKWVYNWAQFCPMNDLHLWQCQAGLGYYNFVANQAYFLLFFCLRLLCLSWWDFWLSFNIKVIHNLQ